MDLEIHSRKDIVASILLQHLTKASISKAKVVLIATDRNY